MPPTKPPLKPRRVPADDITVEAEGVTYYPHRDEWVEFKGRPSVGLALGIEGGPPEEVFTLLLEVIHDWTLTDDEGEPYDRPPTAAALRRLAPEELTWLRTHASLSRRGEIDRGNAYAPST